MANADLLTNWASAKRGRPLENKHYWLARHRDDSRHYLSSTLVSNRLLSHLRVDRLQGASVGRPIWRAAEHVAWQSESASRLQTKAARLSPLLKFAAYLGVGGVTAGAIVLGAALGALALGTPLGWSAAAIGAIGVKIAAVGMVPWTAVVAWRGLLNWRAERCAGSARVRARELGELARAKAAWVQRKAEIVSHLQISAPAFQADLG